MRVEIFSSAVYIKTNQTNLRKTAMKIKFGIGRRCTNPELPISLAGYFNKRMWDHVLDDIEVRAVAFKEDGEYSCIIQFDLLSINYFLYNFVFDALKESGLKGFSSKNVLICATHSHTCPDPFSDPNSMEYCRFIAGKAAEALKEAVENMQKGELFYTMTQDHRFQFNRRYWMKNGTVVTNPGKLNPDILRPEGEIDPQIPMLAVKNDKGIALLITSIVNHTDTIGGCGVSADWPGIMRRKLEPTLAPGAMVLPLIGASGNINHFDVSTDMNQTCPDEPRRIGEGYAETVAAALDSFVPAPGKKIRMVTAKVKSSPRIVDPADVAEARAVVEKFKEIDTSQVGKGIDITSEDLAKGAPFALKFFAEKLLDLAEHPRVPNFLLTKIEFGSHVVLASLPSEPFVEIGLTLRRSVFRDKFCIVTSHGNYNGGKEIFSGYIPNSWNYGRGGYETTPRSSNFGLDTADVLIAKWRKLALK